MKPINVLVLLLLSITCTAQNPHSFDLAPGSTPSHPFGFYAGQDKLYFATFEPNATSQQRCLLRSIDKNDSLKVYTEFQNMLHLPPQVGPITELNNEIFFVSYFGSLSNRLCKSTPSQPFQVIDDIKSGNTGVNPRLMTPLNNKIYFVAWDNMSDELFEYDPTLDTVIQRTHLSTQQISIDIRELVIYNNQLFFILTDTTIGSGQRYLHKYDPASQTTSMINNQNPVFVNPSMPTVYNNKLYFAAHNQNVLDSNHLMYIYEYDGTAAPQRLPGSGIKAWYKGGDWEVFIPYRGALLYQTDSALDLYWKYDFANQKTIRVSKAVLGPQYDSIYTRLLTAYEDKIYFLAIDDSNVQRLMSYNDTIMYFIPGLTNPWDPRIFNGYLYLQGQLLSTEGIELCRLDKFRASVTSIKKAIHNVFIYPNPVTNIAHLQFTLQQGQALNISITDLQGRVVYKTGDVLYSASTHTIDIPMQNLATGTYVYMLKSNEGSTIHAGKLQKL